MASQRGLSAHGRETSDIQVAATTCFQLIDNILRVLPTAHIAIEQLDDIRAKLRLWTTEFKVFAKGSDSISRTLRLHHGRFASVMILEGVLDLRVSLEQCKSTLFSYSTAAS